MADGAYYYSATYKAAGGNGGGINGEDGSVYSHSEYKGGGASQIAGGTAGTGNNASYNGTAGTAGTGGSTGRKYSSNTVYSNGAGRRWLVWWWSCSKLY